MNKRILAAFVAASALIVQAAMGAASADPGSATHVDSVNGSAGSSTVAITGSATFVDVPKLLGTDGTGDATVAGIGGDVTTMTIARPNPASPNLLFTMGVADLGATNGTPPIGYFWPVSVDDTDSGFYLEARNISLAFPTAAAPTFKLMQDQPDGFADIATLTGTMGAGKVTWTMGMSRIAALVGSVVGQGGAGGGLGSAAGAPGALRLNANAGGDGAALDEAYTVPGAKVSVGIAPAGTDESAVALTGTATVNTTTGAFSGSIPKPAQAGSYIVVAQACYAPDNCGLKSTTITI